MRIINRTEFLLLPAGTLFSKYVPCAFDNLCIKCDTTDYDDFRYQSIADSIDCNDSNEFVDLLHKSQDTGCSIPMTFDDEMRDGMFDSDQLFAVWDRADVESLILRLRISLLYGYKKG